MLGFENPVRQVFAVRRWRRSQSAETLPSRIGEDPPRRRGRVDLNSQRRAVLAALSVALLAAVAQTACAPAPPAESPQAARLFSDRPSVLLIVIDALRRDHVGAYGYTAPTTPFLDRLTENGVVFENAYAQAPQTFISTATLLTSRYFPLTWRYDRDPSTGAPRQTEGNPRLPVSYLQEENLTLAEVLRAAGYDTVGVFTNPNHHPTSGFWQGFEEPRYPRRKKGKAYAPAPQVRREFLRWLEGRRSDRPYFAYVHFMDVHNPYRPPRWLRDQFVTTQGRDLYTNGQPSGDQVPTAADVQYMTELYDACIRGVDTIIEVLVADLKERGLWSNTLLVVTSDHGDEFMEHGGLGHGTTLEKELIRVPLLFHVVPESGTRLDPRLARRVDQLVRNLDVAPTILDLAQAPIPADFEGVSLVPWLREEGSDREHPSTSFAWISQLRSFTTPDWHLTWNRAKDTKRLYYHHTDPRGLYDVAADHPAIVGMLSETMQRYEERRVATLRQAHRLEQQREQANRSPDDQVVEQLKALGYLQ